MPLLLESPTDQGHQNLLGQHLRTILEVADELVSQMPLEAQIWAAQVKEELHKGVELIEQELELLGLQQICALRRALEERDRQIMALSPPGTPIHSQREVALRAANGGEAPLVSSQVMDVDVESPSIESFSELHVSPIPAQLIPGDTGDTLGNLFEDLEGLSVQSVPEIAVSEPPLIAEAVPPVEVVEAELQTVAAAEPPLQADSADEILRQEFQLMQAEMAQQKQQLASITSVVDEQKAENQQLQSLVTSLEEKLSQKETDLEKSMIRSLLLEAGLDPDVA
jgi:hypothetical protein